MPELLWSKTFSGSFPRVLLTSSSHILFEFAPPSAQQAFGPGTVLCLDRQGKVLWQRENTIAVDILPGDKWIAKNGDGSALAIVDVAGTPVARWEGPARWRSRRPGIATVVTYPDSVAFATKEGHVFVTDHALEPVAEFPWPCEGGPWLGCFNGRYFHWVQNNEIWCCDLTGRADKLRDIPMDLVEQAMTDFETETGLPALRSLRIAVPMDDIGDLAAYLRREKGESVPFRRGERPHGYFWILSHDEKNDVYFLTTKTAPHVLTCFENDLSVRWCRYIYHDCCGGAAYRLPGRLWVASTSCGGVLSWLDELGRVIFRSKPHPGMFLAIALDTTLAVLESGRVIVSGSPGLMAYEWGELVWHLNLDYVEYAVSERDGLLVVGHWLRSERAVALEARRLET